MPRINWYVTARAKAKNLLDENIWVYLSSERSDDLFGNQKIWSTEKYGFFTDTEVSALNLAKGLNREGDDFKDVDIDSIEIMVRREEMVKEISYHSVDADIRKRMIIERN